MPAEPEPWEATLPAALALARVRAGGRDDEAWPLARWRAVLARLSRGERRAVYLRCVVGLTPLRSAEDFGPRLSRGNEGTAFSKAVRKLRDRGDPPARSDRRLEDSGPWGSSPRPFFVRGGTPSERSAPL